MGAWLVTGSSSGSSLASPSPSPPRSPEQRKTIDDFNRRVADLRKEVGAWREMHARIQEPFGPEVGRAGRDRGIAVPPRRPSGRRRGSRRATS